MSEPNAGERWRDDPSWSLVEWDADYWDGKAPSASPPAEAELAQPGLWASVYAEKPTRPVATWYRPSVTADAPTTIAEA